MINVIETLTAQQQPRIGSQINTMAHLAKRSAALQTKANFVFSYFLEMTTLKIETTN